MAVITIKGRDYTPVLVKDSFDRRAQQFRNNIITTLRKLGLTEDDIEVPLEAAAFRKVPAAVTWYMEGHRLYYSCAVLRSFAENLNMVSKVVDTEVQALIAGETELHDFITKFTENENIDEIRKEARRTLGVAEDENDLEVINKAYKDLAREHHPDASTGDIERFKHINNAHKTLKRELS